MARLPNVKRVHRALGVAAALAATGTVSLPALADGGIPRAWGILFEPGNSEHIVLRSLFWGLFDHRAGQTDWSLYCSQAFGGKALVKEDHPTVLAQGGRILVAGGFEGLTVTDDGCAWRMVDAFGGDSVLGLAPADADGKNFVLLTVAGDGNGGVTSVAYSSSDRGDTWKPLAGALPKDYSLASIAVAPSDPNRLYVAGVKVNVGSRLLASSADGGKTWASFPIPADDGFDPVTVVAIRNSDPDTVFVRIGGPDDVGAPPAPDTLWATSDGGKNWVRSFAGSGDIAGVVLSSDEKKVLVAGPMDGVKSAPLADALAGKDTFSSIFAGQVWGLARGADGKLYAGNDDFNPSSHFMLGVSSDEGMTFNPVMTHCSVQFPVCPDSSTMEAVCREQWERQGGYVTDYLDMGACAAGKGGAAGAAGTAGMSGAGGATGTGNASGGAGGTPPDSSKGGTGDTSGSDRVKVDPGCAVSSGRSGSTFMGALLIAAAALGFSRARARRRRD